MPFLSLRVFGLLTPEEGRRIYRLKQCVNKRKDEDNSPKTLNDKNDKNLQASSQKFRQLKMNGILKTILLSASG